MFDVGQVISTISTICSPAFKAPKCVEPAGKQTCIFQVRISLWDSATFIENRNGRCRVRRWGLTYTLLYGKGVISCVEPAQVSGCDGRWLIWCFVVQSKMLQPPAVKQAMIKISASVVWLPHSVSSARYCTMPMSNMILLLICHGQPTVGDADRNSELSLKRSFLRACILWL